MKPKHPNVISAARERKTLKEEAEKECLNQCFPDMYMQNKVEMDFDDQRLQGACKKSCVAWTSKEADKKIWEKMKFEKKAKAKKHNEQFCSEEDMNDLLVHGDSSAENEITEKTTKKADPKAIAKLSKRCRQIEDKLRQKTLTVGWATSFESSSRYSKPYKGNGISCWSWQLLHLVDSCFARTIPTTALQALADGEAAYDDNFAENCTGDYVGLYCLNGGACFRTKAMGTFVLSCHCQPGWYGKRCEYMDIRDRYLPVQKQVRTAGLAVSVALLIGSVALICLVLYICYWQKRRQCPNSSGTNRSTGSATTCASRTSNVQDAPKDVS
ncbi:hEGF domain containing protein [Trichuris trichiura]|uniref:HEGF domain containing protein n=1 Tax=Trichuris trichiura TaxID=36087 RepID=A0A077YX47_TRITR|nr:hEGF domain containing protein [Trichuris trichiura]